jgi:type I restriction enzyme S subunit
MSNNNDAAIALLEKHFDIAFAAPDGIKKLRELILSLAMQGKLVPQDPNDQPASKLLKEIEAEKKRLMKEGKIKQSKSLPEIKSDEIPYDLPDSWKWCRWNDIALKIGDIDHKMPNEVTDGVPYVSPRDFFGKNEINFAQAKKISVQDFEALRLKIQPQKFDIIFPRYGTLGVNRFVLVDIDFLSSYSCAVIKNLQGFIDPKYSYYYSISKLVRAEIERYTKKTTQANVGVQSIQIFLFPLPPLAEQRRIVAKIDELMARCDELEKLRSDRARKQITVHNSALNRLLIAKQQSEFNTAWQFITQHFSELYSVKENVAELRKAILQLAVMGKLVPQDPSDQPASELLKEIEEEKERLVKEGKIKKSQPLPKIKLDEVPYNLPTGWEWTNLQDLFALVTDGDHQAPPKVDAGIPFLVIGNLNTGKVTWEDCRFVPHDYYESIDWGRKPSKNDILYTVTGSYGIPIFIDCNRKFCVQRHVAILKSVESSPTEYITHLLRSKYAFNYATSVATGIAQKTVPLSGLRRMPIAVPPMNEQSRIVAKIDQLMALCDNLEKQIDNANSKQTNLLNAVMTKI